MTDAENLEAIRAIIKDELSSIKTDINDHKQTHAELEALVDKRFNEMKEMFPESFGDLEFLREYMDALKKSGYSYLDYAMMIDSIYII